VKNGNRYDVKWKCYVSYVVNSTVVGTCKMRGVGRSFLGHASADMQYSVMYTSVYKNLYISSLTHLADTVFVFCAGICVVSVLSVLFASVILREYDIILAVDYHFLPLS